MESSLDGRKRGQSQRSWRDKIHEAMRVESRKAATAVDTLPVADVAVFAGKYDPFKNI